MANILEYLAHTFEIIENWLFTPGGLSPHGFCLLWEPSLLYLYAGSDLAIGLAYFSIPAALLIFHRRRRDLVFAPVLWLFVAFIVLCGLTHWFDVLTLWVPAYGLEALTKVATAAVSLVTAVALWAVLPKMLSLPSAEQLYQANLALQETEERQKNAFENSPIALFSLDNHGIVRKVSNSWLDLLGYERGDVIGQPFDAFLVPGQDRWSLENFNKLKSVEITPDIEALFIRKDGTTIETLVSTRLQFDRERNWLVGDVVDLTERRHAEAALKASEERLRQSQKLEAIGHLTGGIAHDFNNMLQGIKGYLTLLEWSLEGDPNADQQAAQIAGARRSLDRATNLTQRMLAFGRRQTLQPKALDIDELIRGMQELMSRSIGPTIELVLRLNSAAHKIYCDANQLENAILNLAINARDAMPEGGKLKIATALVNRKEMAVIDQSTSPAEYFIKISAEDNGAGMEPHVLSLVFEPFFTTKPIGQGTGLGLSQIQGFVHQSGGAVDIASQAGEGTIVCLYFPCVDEASMDAPGVASSSETTLGLTFAQKNAEKSATILLIDDEPSVRVPAAEALRRLGFTVIEAENGIDGLNLIKSAADFDLIVTDVGLPGLNGRQLADAARETRPKLPILFVTGYAGSALEQIGSSPAMQVLIKPFDLAALSGKVREMIAASREKEMVSV